MKIIFLFLILFAIILWYDREDMTDIEKNFRNY